MFDYKCSECEFCKSISKIGNKRNSCYCEHPNQDYIKDYYNKNNKHSFPGFINFSKPFETKPNIKTSPKWCPRKGGDNKK